MYVLYVLLLHTALFLSIAENVSKYTHTHTLNLAPQSFWKFREFSIPG